ncbi:hypothetical protein Rhopal_007345-T1 [Rhodotorula paludigena]|uniref:Uncharacterized protein n=1 Tax=Rhodotorula paludigena TaxID=86838 RepID=A0AAV5GXQ3_9BASI|nr:hypothetical protein Rhopal_007345-T1 [Rhodotorula paludigena]
MVHAADLVPAVLFLVAYTAYFALLVYLYATKAILWKSRYSFVFTHVVFRLVGMALVLIAYLVFAAEGYFSLILCAYRFLVVWMQDHFGASYLEPRIPKGTPRREKFRMHMRAPLVSVHYALIAANALIITGSSYMVGAMDQEDPRHESKLDKAKGLRVAGTAVFLAIVQAHLAVCLHMWRKRRDRTLFLITFTWPFLTVRGVYGILGILVPAFSCNPDAYGSSGFSSTFLAGEHCMGTLMEWIACGLLISTHFSAINGGDELREDGGSEDEEREGDEDGQALQMRRSSEPKSGMSV